MKKLLQQQVAVITGGNSGIGKAIALKFAEHGAKVAILGTNPERGGQVIEEICKLAQQKDQASFHQVNVANTQEVETVIKQILVEYGKIDILVNNAGITRDQLLMKMSEEDWDSVLEVNVKSCYNTSRATIRSMIRARKGSIINMSSVVGLTGNPGQVNYAASKAAIIGFTKALAKEVATRNIRVNCVAPGFIETRMTEVLNEDQKRSILAKIPMERLGNPEDIAHAVLFLASDLASYITGHVLTVDGGMV